MGISEAHEILNKLNLTFTEEEKLNMMSFIVVPECIECKGEGGGNDNKCEVCDGYGKCYRSINVSQADSEMSVTTRRLVQTGPEGNPGLVYVLIFLFILLLCILWKRFTRSKRTRRFSTIRDLEEY